MFVEVLLVPGEPREGGLGAQDGEEEGERAVFEVVEPGGVDDEPGRDGDGGNDEEEGEEERGPIRALLGLPRLGLFSRGSGHRSPQSAFLVVLLVEEVSGFFSEPLPFELEESAESVPLVVSLGSVFVAFLL